MVFPREFSFSIWRAQNCFWFWLEQSDEAEDGLARHCSGGGGHKTWVAVGDIKHMLVFVFSLKCRGAPWKTTFCLNWIGFSVSAISRFYRDMWYQMPWHILDMLWQPRPHCLSKPFFRHLDGGQNFTCNLYTVKLFFWRTSVLFVEPLVPLFGTSGDVCPGYQSQSARFLASCNGFLRFTSGATPADLLTASMVTQHFTLYPP